MMDRLSNRSIVNVLTNTVLLLTLVGCAVGNRHQYSDVIADIRSTGSLSVAVATLEQRPYVLSANKNPNFVGLQRGGFGNPFDVKTENDKPFADNVTEVLVNSLKAKGFEAVPLTTSLVDTREETTKKLIATKGRRSLLVTVNEWKTDTYTNVALHYDVEVEVRDLTGKVLATTHIDGKDNLGGSAWNPPAVARETAPVALKQKLERLMNEPEVLKALQEI